MGCAVTSPKSSANACGSMAQAFQFWGRVRVASRGCRNSRGHCLVAFPQSKLSNCQTLRLWVPG